MERPHAAARAWREGLCVSRTRPSRSLRPSSHSFRHLERPFEKGLSIIVPLAARVPFGRFRKAFRRSKCLSTIIAFERLNASF